MSWHALLLFVCQMKPSSKPLIHQIMYFSPRNVLISHEMNQLKLSLKCNSTFCCWFGFLVHFWTFKSVNANVHGARKIVIATIHNNTHMPQNVHRSQTAFKIVYSIDYCMDREREIFCLLLRMCQRKSVNWFKHWLLDVAVSI